MLLRGVLEQKATGAGSERLVDVLVKVEGREHEHTGRVLAAIDDPAGRLDAVHVRHANVHEDDIRVELARSATASAPSAASPTTSMSGSAAKDHAKAAAHERLVVREQDANRHARAEPSGRRTRSA